MKRRRESDSSLLIGLILGAAIGAAGVTILSAQPEDAPTLPVLNTAGRHSRGSGSLGSSDDSGDAIIVRGDNSANSTSIPGSLIYAPQDSMPAADKALEENDGSRTEGASEGAS